ncbi:MAG: tetratricopeptide repeat protein, partial [Spirochaetales bacterium]|nr:tetratricopeptide repeat protein [Spirochaetales bacterium]
EEVYTSIGSYVVTGDITGAIEAFETLNRLKPEDPETKNAYVKLLLAAGKLEEAEKIISEILEEHPDNPGAYFNRALLCALTKDSEGRETSLLKVLEADPTFPGVHALLGELSMERKDYATAEEYFSAGLALNPGDPLLHAALAGLYRRRGDLVQALEHLDEALELDETFSFAYADRAAVKLALDDFSGAEEDYTKALEYDSDFSWHYIDRAKVYLRSRRLEEALSDLDRAIVLDPEQVYPYILRAGVRDETDRLSGALEDYLVVLEKRPKYYFAYEPAALLLFMEQRWEEAEDLFVKAYPYARDRWEFLLLAGLCRLRRGADAKSYFEEQLSGMPRDSLLYQVSRVFLEPGYEARAVHMVQQGGRSPEAVQALFYLAQYFLISGSETTALHYFLQVEERKEYGLIETRLAKAERVRISDIF